MFENLVGLQVANEELYREYRKAMLPILKEHGGDFGYDFMVSDVLINQSGNPINRVSVRLLASNGRCAECEGDLCLWPNRYH